MNTKAPKPATKLTFICQRIDIIKHQASICTYCERVSVCLPGASRLMCPNISQNNTSTTLRCHIYDNHSIIHLLGLPLPCVDPTAMLPAHIWLRGAAALGPGWDLPLVMGHLGGQMKPRLDECFVYYGYGALWRH